MILLDAGEILNEIFGLDVLVIAHKLIMESKYMVERKEDADKNLKYYSNLFPREQEPAKIVLNEVPFRKIRSKEVTIKLINFLHNLFESNFNLALSKTKNTVIFIDKLSTF